MKARAILFTAPCEVKVAPVEIPEPRRGEILIESEVTAISPGTEGRCLRGQQPGSPPFPFIPGYAGVGNVIADRSKLGLEGKRVFFSGTKRASVAIQWGGQVSHAVVPAASAVPVPEEVESAHAVFAKMAAIALRGRHNARPRPGQTVAVIGQGLIGTLSARLFKAAGACVLAVDLSPDRVAVARKIGLEAAVPEGSIAETVKAHFGDGADIVVDATGHPAVLREALAAARQKGWAGRWEPSSKLVVQGSYSGDICIPYHEAFFREVVMLFPRDTPLQGIYQAMELIRTRQFEIKDLASVRVKPEEAPSVYRGLASQADLLTAVIDW